MASGIPALANVQLSMLQLPEVAREQVPALMQSEIASAQAPALIAQRDQDASETVQALPETDWRGVDNSLDDSSEKDARYRRPAGRQPSRQGRAASPPNIHPRGLGSLVDLRV